MAEEIFDDAFIDGLPEDRHEALSSICQHIIYFRNQQVTKKRSTSVWHDKYLRAYAFLEAYTEGLDIGFKKISFGNDHDSNIDSIRQSVFGIRDNLKVIKTALNYDSAKEKYTLKLGKGFAYEFSDDDLKRIQELISELRQLITDSDKFDDNHRERLLKRLEKLQGELHKRMSNLDKFWGLMGEAGVALGKFGKDAKPFVDRILEIEGIAWRTQTRAEELSSGFGMPLLKSAEDPPDEEE